MKAFLRMTAVALLVAMMLVVATAATAGMFGKTVIPPAIGSVCSKGAMGQWPVGKEFCLDIQTVAVNYLKLKCSGGTWHLTGAIFGQTQGSAPTCCFPRSCAPALKNAYFKKRIDRAAHYV